MGPGCYPEAGPCDAISVSGFVKDISLLIIVVTPCMLLSYSIIIPTTAHI